MDGYVERLEACGIATPIAEEICHDTLVNFSVSELEIVVKEKEIKSLGDNNVGILQSKPNRKSSWGLRNQSTD